MDEFFDRVSVEIGLVVGMQVAEVRRLLEERERQNQTAISANIPAATRQFSSSESCCNSSGCQRKGLTPPMDGNTGCGGASQRRLTREAQVGVSRWLRPLNGVYLSPYLPFLQSHF